MALIPAAEINASIDNATTLRRPMIIKQMAYGSSSAALYIEANQARNGKAGWIYMATSVGTVSAAGSVSAQVANLI
jgi:hypothetical protein